MPHPLLETDHVLTAPDAYLDAVGDLFDRFDGRSQDSGNLSYGVRVDGDRYFVKTAGRPDHTVGVLTHPQRIQLLRNAILLHASYHHEAVPTIRHVIESPTGPLLVYPWVEGDLVRAAAASRHDPASAFQRFRKFPLPEILKGLDTVFAVHAGLAGLGWIAADFYDGCLIYDFDRRQMHLVDLDNYQNGLFRNRMGRMFGSSRFMAPEEFELGAMIDQRTTVFTMGRTAAVLLSDGSLEPAPFRGSDALHEIVWRACRRQPDERYASVAAFAQAWHTARAAD